MERFPMELAATIINLELQKSQILNKANNDSRMCTCRSRIFVNYINLCQQFFIKFTDKIIKFLEDKDYEKTFSTNDLKKWYLHEMYTKLYHKKCISEKMILMFKLFQERGDTKFFDAFEIKFKSLLLSHKTNPEFINDLLKLYKEISEWIENHIINILTLKILCDNISDQILVDYGNIIVADNEECSTTHCITCYENEHNCGAKQLLEGNEDIHLYITKETHPADWLVYFFDTIKKYHTNVADVKVIYDFILYDEDVYDMDETMYDVIITSKNYFKSIDIINFEYVNFGKYYETLKEYTE